MTSDGNTGVARQGSSLILLLLAGCAVAACRQPTLSAVVALEPNVVIDGGKQGVPLLYRPTSVAFGPRDELFILDAGNHSVFVVGLDGRLHKTIGGQGEGPGEFSFFGSGGHLAVGDDAFAVLESSRNRISVFSLEGRLLDTFQTEVSAQSIAFGSSALYVSVVDGAASQINEYDLSGVLQREFPGVVMGGPGEQAAIPRFLQLSSVAVDQGDSVWHAFRAWPLLRRHTGELVEDQWMDFSWLRDPEVAAQYKRPRALLVRPLQGATPPELRKSVSFDIDCTADTFCAVSLALGVVQSFDLDGNPLAAYRLWRDPETGFYPTRDIAVTKDGKTLCAADNDSSSVRCYTGLSGLGGL